VVDTPMTRLPFVDGAQLLALVSWADAVDVLGRVLRGPADPAAGPARAVVPTEHGELLLMPAEIGGAVGVKVASVTPGNPAVGLPRIQAVYVLFDAATLTPRLLLDGTGLTTLRTPALSALAIQHLAAADAHRLVVFGSGPQAWGHVHAIRAVRPVETVRLVGRDQDRAEALAARLRGEGVAAGVGTVEDVREADIVVCATTASSPVFDGALLAPGACVAAVGSHHPHQRELDDTVFRRAGRVVVEDRATALREAGDVVQAIAAGALTEARLTALAELVAAETTDTEGISVFKSVGMSWQDLALVEHARKALDQG
jgi:ornithine cyclodeaminase/alanine dehydrogenase-like protein (mu-crystallin family)